MGRRHPTIYSTDVSEPWGGVLSSRLLLVCLQIQDSIPTYYLSNSNPEERLTHASTQLITHIQSCPACSLSIHHLFENPNPQDQSFPEPEEHVKERSEGKRKHACTYSTAREIVPNWFRKCLKAQSQKRSQKIFNVKKVLPDQPRLSVKSPFRGRIKKKNTLPRQCYARKYTRVLVFKEET